PDRSDYLELLQAIGHDNLMRGIRFPTTVLGSPERALEYANSLDALYRGYPYYMLERARAEASLAGRADGPVAAGLAQSSYGHAAMAMLWEQAQSRISAQAFEVMTREIRTDYLFDNNLYATDIPYHPGYPHWADGGNAKAIRSNAEAALANSASIVYPAQE